MFAFRLLMACVLIIACLSVAGGELHAQQAEPRQRASLLPVIPLPQEVKLKPGDDFVFDNTAAIVLGDGNSADDRLAAETLQEDLRTLCKLEISIKAGGESTAAMRTVLLGIPSRDKLVQDACQKRGLKVDEALGAEGYVLDVDPTSILIAANDAAGVFYGVQTLRQLAGTGRVPGVSIRDWPGLRYRCVQDDVSRGPIPTMDYFKREIRTISQYKLNMFCLYIEHVFQFAKHPEIAPPDGHLDAADIKELVAYGKKYHVEMLPQIQSFGHQYHVLKLPEFADIRESPKGGGVFCPLVERTYKVIGDFYSEYVPCFESKFIHVGCDETQELGTGRSQKKAAEIGVDMLYLQHMNRLLELLKPYGKRPMFWGDIALHYKDTMVGKLPRDYVVMNWTYGGAESFEDRLKVFADAGFDQFVCPGVSCWSMIFPDYGNARKNIANFVRDGAKFHALGMLNTAWDDDGENLTNWNWYGFIFSADCAWRPGRVQDVDFDAVFPASFYGTPSDELSRAINLLSECNRALGLPGASDPVFWEDPFVGKSPISTLKFWSKAERLLAMANEALGIVEGQRAKVTRNADTLDYLSFPAKRFRHLAQKFLTANEIGKAYRQAFETPGDKALVERNPGEAITKLKQLKTDIEALREEYSRLWLQENRPYWLDKIQVRYDNLARVYENMAAQIQKALDDYQAKAVLPDPETLHLAERTLPQRSTKSASMKAPKAFEKAAWWNAEWRYRTLVKVQNGAVAKRDYPVEIQINFSDQLKQAGASAALDENSIRVVECDDAGKVKAEVPCQFDKAKGYEKQLRASGNLVWIMEGELPAKASRWFHVYFDATDAPAKPALAVADPVKTADAECKPKGPHPEGSKWIENSRYKILLGRQGGHLYIWEVKGLNNMDITQPGEASWCGFNDTRDLRDLFLDLTCEAAGPVLVRYRASAPDGSYKTLSFYRSLPCVETYLSLAVNFFWDYDNTKNMIEGRPTPGRYALGDGEEDVIPLKPGEQNFGCKSPCFWGVRYREDGLAIGLVTPDDKASHHIGPGGGMGGCGIEGGQVRVSHFVTFADVLQDPKGTAVALQQTLVIASQPAVSLAPSEAKR